MDAKVGLDLNDVALLVRVVQTGSFSAAARERGVDDIAQGTDHVRELQKEPRGRVRIIAPLIFSGIVTRSLYGYLAEHPGVAVDLELGQRSVDLFGEGFDIAILSHKVDSTDFVARELRSSTRKVLFASPDYLAARGVPRRVEDLAHHDCIAMPVAGAAGAQDGTVTWTLARGDHKRRITLTPRLVVNEPGAARNAVLAGLGIGLFPETRGAEDVASKRLERVLASYQGEAAGLYLLYRAHRSLTAAIRTCIDHFSEDLAATHRRP